MDAFRLKAGLCALMISIACTISAQNHYTHHAILELTDSQEVNEIKLNDAGQMLITLASPSLSADGGKYQSYYYDPVRGLIPIPGKNVQATSINESGYITGTIHSGHFAQFFIFHPEEGLKTDLGNGYSTAQDINNQGMIAGWSLTTERIEYEGDTFAVTQAFLYIPGSGFVKPNLMGEGFHRTHVTALNDRGMLTGFADHVAGTRHAFRYQPGTGTIDLGPIGALGEVRAMNVLGTVIAEWAGSSIDLPIDEPSHYAIVITPGKQRVDLDKLGLGNSEVVAINNRDTIIGRVSNTDGIDQAFAADIHGKMHFLKLSTEHSSLRSLAFDLNDQNVIVGAVESLIKMSSNDSRTLYEKMIMRWEPIIWENENATAASIRVKEAPSLRGMPLAVNKAGQLVIIGLENEKSENLQIWILEPEKKEQ